jgi:2-iminobutanoate/2-iminopropanoate deaminase
MTERRIIETPKSPIPKVPSSQAFVVGHLIFCSGQIAIDAATNSVVEETLTGQTKKALENLKNILEEAGASMDCVVKTTNYLTDLSRVEEFNEVYQAFFHKPYPPRTVVEVNKLARGVLVEVDAIAFLDSLND